MSRDTHKVSGRTSQSYLFCDPDLFWMPLISSSSLSTIHAMSIMMERFWFIVSLFIILFTATVAESFIVPVQTNKLASSSLSPASTSNKSRRGTQHYWHTTTTATTTTTSAAAQPDNMASSSSDNVPHPFCQLPGDPSLILTTNVDLGDKKMEIMKACSKAISQATGKPESYIAVCITDKADLIFGGTAAPAALGCLYSIGAIAQTSNGQIQAAVTDLLEPHGLTDEARIYINFFDVPRANVGWSRRTFAG